MTIACIQVFWQLIKRGRNDIIFFFDHLKELGSDGPGGGGGGRRGTPI